MVYVLNQSKQPLMPTRDHRKVRLLLSQGKAKVVTRTPFTIMLLHSVREYKQKLTLGLDAGSKLMGMSVTSENQEVYASETALRTDIVDLLSARRAFRRARRNRTTRYRAPRFNNRMRSKNKGWLAPSIEQKISTHVKLVQNVHALLPISRIIVEVAAFDIQKIRNDAITGCQYQEGEQLGFWNVREYVLFRDGHICQHCKGKSKDKVLNVHHIESRRTGGDAPNNLITLCETCHSAYHQGFLQLKIKRGMAFRDAAFMGIMRWAFYNRLKDLYTAVSLTFGYLTKNARIRHGLEKAHAVDARCISGNPTAQPAGEIFFQRAVRRHNRQLHKATILKGGYRKANQAPKYVFGYQLFDKVLFKGQEGFIFGRRSSGSFDVRQLDGTKLSAGVSYKKLVLLEKRKAILTERRATEGSAISSPYLKTGVSVAN